MQNCYFIGLHDEAQALATDMLENRPKSGEEFAVSDSKLIGLEVMKLCASERDDQEAMSTYGSRAWQHRADYIRAERKMQQRRAEWQARATK